MLVELLQPAGPRLARRWLKALLSVDRGRRAALVEEVERRVGLTRESTVSEIEIVHPPVQRDGYVEQTTTTYAVQPRARTSPRIAKPGVRKAR